MPRASGSESRVMAAGTDTPAGSAALDYSAPPPPRTGFAQNAAGPGQGICSHRGLSRHGGRVTVRLGVSPPETGLVSGHDDRTAPGPAHLRCSERRRIRNHREASPGAEIGEFRDSSRAHQASGCRWRVGRCRPGRERRPGRAAPQAWALSLGVAMRLVTALGLGPSRVTSHE